MSRFLALVLLASLAVAPAAVAQDVPRENPRLPRPSKVRGAPSPHGKASISESVFIGDRAPDFDLDGSNGRSVKLSSLRGDWIVLVFADRWQSAAALAAAERELRPLGARVVAVCHEKQQTLTAAAARDTVPLLMLADATGEVTGLYGLYDWGRSQTKPGFFVLGRDGTVHIAVIGRLFPSDQIVYVVQLVMGE